MFALAQRVVLAGGWSRRTIAFTAGAFGGLAMAPLDLVPAMVVPMTLAVWLIDGSGRREGRLGRFIGWRSCWSAAGAGWWWGFGYFLAGLWWLGAACLVEPSKFLWALPFAVLGTPIILAFFPAFGFALARALWSAGAGRVLALGFGLGASEWLRGWVLTGFPWNAYGMALGDTLLFGQAASLAGIGGLTLATVVIFAAPATLADPVGAVRRLAPTVVALLCLGALAGYGRHRLDRGPVADVPGIRLRILQPDVPQDASFSYENRTKILDSYLSLSNRVTADGKSLKDVTHLIWPESAFPFILSRDPDALAAIGDALPDGTTLITGAARLERQPGTPGSSTRNHYFNAIQVVGPGGTILDSYDKVHLVPFGEYLPVEGVLRRLGITNFVAIPGGFDPGASRRLIEVPGLPPVAPLVCYEAIFSGAVLPDDDSAARAGVLLNVTNDGWFGDTSGPYQHLAMARLRAIEQGLPLIRAANTGVSAIIDPYGRVLASLPLGRADVLDGPLPKRIAPPLFARDGTRVLQVFYGIAFAAALAGALLRRA